MTNDTAPNRQVVQDWLVSYVAAVVDVAPDAVTLDTPFHELGVDSAEVVIMTGVMEEEFAVELDAELPFKHPTIAGLLDALEERGVVSAR